MSEKKSAPKYSSLDGLRTIACLGIILMHVAANSQYAITGFVYQRLIPSFTDFVFLFMVLSAFGMCCGYHRKVLNNQLDLTEFYKKRYLKILPFFACLILLDLLVSFSRESLFEAIADLSLTFGLFPNQISVIGVGWFLGLVFAFYMIFPFYCVLTATKTRAWVFFALSLVMNYLCHVYFDVHRQNIIFSLCFFLAGGLIYWYRERLSHLSWLVSLPLLLLSIALYFIIGSRSITNLCISTTAVIFALGTGGSILDRPIFHFISGISLEMYLSHMVIFRVVQALHLNTRFGNGVAQYLITCLLVIVIDILFSYTGQKVLAQCLAQIEKRFAHKTK